MAFTRLVCPECGKVMRPAKPVSAGKKVRCAECDTVFIAGQDEEDEVDEQPKKKPKKAAPKKEPEKAAKSKTKPAPKNEEQETYGYIRDPDLDNNDDDDDDPRKKKKKKKNEVDYMPDESVRDLRGPAIVKLTPPSNWLQLAGAVGFLGWMILVFFLTIPVVFPITEDKKPDEGRPRTQEEKEKAAKPPVKFFEFAGIDFYTNYLPMLAIMIAGMIYSAMVVGGGIQMQNLESRTFAIIGSVMVMIPFHLGGVAIFLGIVLRYGLMQLLDDADYTFLLTNVLLGALYLGCLLVGIQALKTLMDEDVIAGFEFKPD